MSFKNIIGHKEIILELRNLLNSKNLPSSMIFYGIEGSGKYITALEIIKNSFCLKNNENEILFENNNKDKEDSCDICKSCIAIDKNLHPDLKIIDYNFQAFINDEPIEKQKSIKIDSIREAIKFAYQKPSISDHKFILINEAHTMTIEAQNSILKLIEAPPENTYIILIASSKNLLLPTINSRCISFKFKPLSENDLQIILNKMNFEKSKTEFLSKISEGSIKKAIEYEKIINLINEKKHLKELLPAILSNSFGNKTYETRSGAFLILDFLISILKRKLENEIKNDEKDKILKTINTLLLNLKYLKANVSPKPIIIISLLEFLKNYTIMEIQ